MAKPARYERKHAVREVRKKYIIATEGEKTEKIYFEKFAEQNYRKNIFIQILPSKSDGDNSPEKVLERINKFARDKIFDKERDECWLVIDFDSWTVKKLSRIYQKCENNNYNLAVSNPCFELWLNLHQDNPKTPQKCSDCLKELKKLLGNYSKNNFDVDKLIENVEKAISKAEQLQKNETEALPTETGTHVYKLVVKLIENTEEASIIFPKF
jgi:hypothetical protein